MGSAEFQLAFSRPFLAGAWRFLVAATDQSFVTLVEQLLVDLPQPDSAVGDFECFVAAHDDGADGRTWHLSGPVFMELEHARLPSTLAMLITSINHAALAAEPERLHLHAGAAVRDGRAVIVSATRDTGKTTTLSSLLLRGWQYLSDEAISLGEGDPLVRAFAKPLSIKPWGRQHVAELPLLPAGDLTEADVLHVTASSLGALVVAAANPGVVVLLRRDPSKQLAQPLLREVHATDAVVALMGETMDAGRFGRDAVVELARLAAVSRCVELHVGTVDATADAIDVLHAEPPPTPLAVAVLPPSAAVRSSVVSVMIGGRVVIHETESGRILALDEAATAVWKVVGGWGADDGIDLDGPVIAPFVQQLAALGLLAGPAVGS